ncbi:MAG: DUF1800 domain-containing protein [Pyrinomonadaceae bacterium]
MKIARRTILQSAAFAGLGLSLTGCERLISRVTDEFGQTIPESLSDIKSKEIDPIFHLLSRAAYGSWIGDLDRVRLTGGEAWIEEQLAPETIDDTLCDLRANRFETIHHNPGLCYEYKKPVLREEIIRYTLLRAIYSRRQLFEVMVGFWTDHLNINLEKGDCIYLKPADDRLVIRANAFGKFKDLIRASVTSPAMLVYLDGKENKKSAPEDIPNENYARELLELHTLGVNGGYTQRDVSEIARCLTGWRIGTGWSRGTVYFDPELHDNDEKLVLGQTIPAGLGAGDTDRVVEIVCGHPSTARYIAGKLVRRFVSDEPPDSLVKSVATVFEQTGGEIKAMVRTILASDEFKTARGSKFKPPFRFIVSCLRAVGADTHAHQPLIEYLLRMGQGPFQYPTPDGYPDEANAWLGTFLWRWNFGFALASNQIPSVAVSLDKVAQAVSGATTKLGFDPQRFLPHFIGRTVSEIELQTLESFSRGKDLGDNNLQAELLGLMLAVPAFQRF